MTTALIIIGIYLLSTVCNFALVKNNDRVQNYMLDLLIELKVGSQYFNNALARLCFIPFYMVAVLGASYFKNID